MGRKSDSLQPGEFHGLLTESEAGKILRRSDRTMQAMRFGILPPMKCGPLAFVRVGKRIMYEVTELKRAIKACREQPKPYLAAKNEVGDST